MSRHASWLISEINVLTPSPANTALCVCAHVRRAVKNAKFTGVCEFNSFQQETRPCMTFFDFSSVSEAVKCKQHRFFQRYLMSTNSLYVLFCDKATAVI